MVLFHGDCGGLRDDGELAGDGDDDCEQDGEQEAWNDVSVDDERPGDGQHDFRER